MEGRYNRLGLAFSVVSAASFRRIGRVDVGGTPMPMKRRRMRLMYAGHVYRNLVSRFGISPLNSQQKLTISSYDETSSRGLTMIS